MIPPPAFQKIQEDLNAYDDWEDRYRFLIELGHQLPPMPDALKTDVTKVQGCASQVWLHAYKQEEGRLHFVGDSDAHIVRGLVAILLSLIQDCVPQDAATLDFQRLFETLGLANHLSPTRTNGFAAMAARAQTLIRDAV